MSGGPGWLQLVCFFMVIDLVLDFDFISKKSSYLVIIVLFI